MHGDCGGAARDVVARRVLDQSPCSRKFIHLPVLIETRILSRYHCVLDGPGHLGQGTSSRSCQKDSALLASCPPAVLKISLFEARLSISDQPVKAMTIDDLTIRCTPRLQGEWIENRPFDRELVEPFMKY